MISSSEREHIKLRIEEELVITSQNVQQYRELTKPISPENAIGRVSRMDAINHKSVNESALRKAEVKLNNLTVALGKLNDTNFRICIRCKSQIPIGRILLVPQAITCVNCTK